MRESSRIRYDQLWVGLGSYLGQNIGGGGGGGGAIAFYYIQYIQIV